jgi:hypothetical protein
MTTLDDRQGRSRPRPLLLVGDEREAGSVTTPMSRSHFHATPPPGEGQFGDRTTGAAR